MQGADWNDLKLVLAIFRGGTFAGAARLLKVNQSTVTRRLAACEARLSAQLFERTPGGLTPTPPGRSLIDRAELIELDVQRALAAVSDADLTVAGTVRVTTVPILANHVLIPALPTLWRAHPDIQVEMIAEPRGLSLRKRETDIAVRLARPQTEAGMTASKIGELAYAAYGRRGAEGPAGWVGYDDSMADLPNSRWIAREAAGQGEHSAHLAVNDATSPLAALAAGLGKSVLPVCVGDGTAGLERIETSSAPPAREIWMLTHPDLRSLARIKAVCTWIRTAVKAAAASPAG